MHCTEVPNRGNEQEPDQVWTLAAPAQSRSLFLITLQEGIICVAFRKSSFKLTMALWLTLVMKSCSWWKPALVLVDIAVSDHFGRQTSLCKDRRPTWEHFYACSFIFYSFLPSIHPSIHSPSNQYFLCTLAGEYYVLVTVLASGDDLFSLLS